MRRQSAVSPLYFPLSSSRGDAPDNTELRLRELRAKSFRYTLALTACTVALCRANASCYRLRAAMFHRTATGWRPTPRDIRFRIQRGRLRRVGHRSIGELRKVNYLGNAARLAYRSIDTSPLESESGLCRE